MSATDYPYPILKAATPRGERAKLVLPGWLVDLVNHQDDELPLVPLVVDETGRPTPRTEIAAAALGLPALRLLCGRLRELGGDTTLGTSRRRRCRELLKDADDLERLWMANAEFQQQLQQARDRLAEDMAAELAEAQRQAQKRLDVHTRELARLEDVVRNRLGMEGGLAHCADTVSKFAVRATGEEVARTFWNRVVGQEGDDLRYLPDRMRHAVDRVGNYMLDAGQSTGPTERALQERRRVAAVRCMGDLLDIAGPLGMHGELAVMALSFRLGGGGCSGEHMVAHLDTGGETLTGPPTPRRRAGRDP